MKKSLILSAKSTKEKPKKQGWGGGIMAYPNKDEIKLYFELNNEAPKQVAERFKVKYRTLMWWIKSEGWERGKHSKAIKPEVVRDEMLQKEHFSLQNATTNKIKNQMRGFIGSEADTINEACLNAMLDEASEKLLLEAMSVNFIQKKHSPSRPFSKKRVFRTHQAQANRQGRTAHHRRG